MSQKKVHKKIQLLPPKAIVALLIGIALLIGGCIGYKIASKQRQDQGASMWHDLREGNYKANWRRGNCDALTIDTPQKGQQVTSPLVISVTVDNSKDNCRWSVFEAQAGSVDLVNDNGDVIGTTTLTTTEDWMTDEPTSYSGTITFTPDTNNKDYTIVVHEEKPSGLSGKKITLPLTY